MSFLESADPEIFQAVSAEYQRQRSTINLIASENYASRAVLEAQGSFLSDKYAEGYPRKKVNFKIGTCKNKKDHIEWRVNGLDKIKKFE